MGSQYNPEEYSPILREFAGYKLVIQACSPRTVSEYMLDLRAFFKYIISKKSKIPYGTPAYEDISVKDVDLALISSVATSDIYDFLLFCEKEFGNASAARARKLSAIKGLYKYLVTKRGLIENNPSVNIETPKKRKSLPKHLTLEESVLLLNTVGRDTECKPEMRLRNYTMITLFLNCGMRLSELVGINIGDIDKQLRSVRVVGKGDKERIIYLNDACKAVLSEYIPVRTAPDKKHIPTKALFLSTRSTRISNRAVQWTVEKYLKAAGLEYRHFSVHKLRHTAATLMYQSGGVDVRVLKEILGHEQLNTTQIYTHVANSDIERAMAMSPLANISPGEMLKSTPFDSITGEDASVGRDDVEDYDDED